MFQTLVTKVLFSFQKKMQNRVIKLQWQQGFVPIMLVLWINRKL